MAESGAAPHILVYEPRVEGHHLGYLKAITEDLLGAGFRLTLAVDRRPESFAQIESALGPLLPRVTVVSAATDGGSKTARLAALLTETGAATAFLPNLDEIASGMLRRAAFGLMPPASLRGRIGGIYHRPRVLADVGWSPNQWLKTAGFRRLLRGGWFDRILLLDPFLLAAFKARTPAAPLHPLPDFFPEDFTADRAAARAQFGISEDRRVFLFYGGGYRRKGLGLAVEAMNALSRDVPAFLFCAGRQPDDREIAESLARLAGQGRALMINRYITDDEEKQVFAASDAVLLPYRRHFGISGVLMRAIGAGLPAIASDENLLGRLVRERDLGVLFPSGDAGALRRAIENMARAPEDDMVRRKAAVRAEAPNWTRAAFRKALLASFGGMNGTGR
jgi:glycosyltransferase involved in cell wall biosynthesis